MAEIVVSNAFVQEWKRDSNEPNPEWAMKIVENHQKKDGDKWVTIGRTYFTVKSGWDAHIDFRKFKAGDRVKVVGKQVTESREYNGQTLYTLVIKATMVDLLQVRTSEATQQQTFAREMSEPF